MKHLTSILCIALLLCGCVDQKEKAAKKTVEAFVEACNTKSLDKMDSLYPGGYFSLVATHPLENMEIKDVIVEDDNYSKVILNTNPVFSKSREMVFHIKADTLGRYYINDSQGCFDFEREGETESPSMRNYYNFAQKVGGILPEHRTDKEIYQQTLRVTRMIYDAGSFCMYVLEHAPPVNCKILYWRHIGAFTHITILITNLLPNTIPPPKCGVELFANKYSKNAISKHAVDIECESIQGNEAKIFNIKVPRNPKISCNFIKCALFYDYSSDQSIRDRGNANIVFGGMMINRNDYDGGEYHRYIKDKEKFCIEIMKKIYPF